MSMDLARVFRHLTTPSLRMRRAFPQATLDAIEQAIRSGEDLHGGELRFVVENSLDGVPLWRGLSPRERTIDLFSQLRVWDTEHNSGVLLYVLMADRCVEIVADRGIDARVGPRAWSDICRSMEARFRAGEFDAGAREGIEAVSALLAEHFPREADDRNELPDQPIVL